MEKKKVEEATNRLYKPYSSSNELQNLYKEYNGEEFSIDEDVYTIDKSFKQLEKENEKLKLMIANKKDMQEQANGIILACSSFISDPLVSKDNVINVLSVTSISKEEWDGCGDEYSKNKILDKLGGVMRWLND